ncbi:MAG: hypothetical protein ACPGVB_14140 [Chitinophagales bacterium]
MADTANDFNISSNPIDLLREILIELRIDKKHLEIMSAGYSANHDGSFTFSEDESYIPKLPVVQLSQRLSEDLFRIPIEWKQSGDPDPLIEFG